MSFLARFLDLPGALTDIVWGNAPALDELPLESLSPREAAAEVLESPRANAILTLEPDVHRVRLRDRVFGLHLSARNALIVGGLHGPVAGAAQALGELRDTLVESGYRRVLIVPMSLEEVPIAESVGFGAIQVAAEAFVDSADFTLSGSARADLRQMCNRARNRGQLAVREIQPSSEGGLWEAVYRRWIGSRPTGHEMGLLVGRPNLDEPLGRRYFGAFGPQKAEPAAVLTAAPGWSGAGYGVDIMARDPDSVPGSMDLLMSETIRLLGEEGIERFSLGASPMAAVPGERLMAPGYLQMFMGFLFNSSLGQRLFGFRQLFHFKKKFAPEWRPVYLAGWPSMGFWSMYAGGRMWGLFGGVR